MAARTARQRLASLLASVASGVPSRGYRQLLLSRLFDRDPDVFLQVLGSRFNRGWNLDDVAFDVRLGSPPTFEQLAPLFASNTLNHGLIGMTIRQGAYLYELARSSNAASAIEIGRFRGGTTIVLASALGVTGKLWSIDVGEKEDRFRNPGARSFDEQTRDFCARHGLNVELLVGDSRTIDVPVEDVDLVLIDGDHSYEGARVDLERFGRKVRLGGSVLLDDAFGDGVFSSHESTVGRVVREAEASGSYRLVARVDRLAHLERVG